jgi:hypothetical protein
MWERINSCNDWEVTVNGAYMFYGPNIPPISLSDKADFDGSSLYI